MLLLALLFLLFLVLLLVRRFLLSIVRTLDRLRACVAHNYPWACVQGETSSFSGRGFLRERAHIHTAADRRQKKQSERRVKTQFIYNLQNFARFAPLVQEIGFSPRLFSSMFAIRTAGVPAIGVAVFSAIASAAVSMSASFAVTACCLSARNVRKNGRGQNWPDRQSNIAMFKTAMWMMCQHTGSRISD